MTDRPTYWDHDGPRAMADVRDYATPPKVLKPPFEIYHDGTHIADANGHICTCDDAELATLVLNALKHHYC